MTEPTSAQDLFKGRHFDQEIIVLCIRWYLTFKLSSCDLVQMMAERGITLSHTTMTNVDLSKFVQKAVDFVSYDSYPEFKVCDLTLPPGFRDRSESRLLSRMRAVSVKFMVLEQQAGPSGQISGVLNGNRDYLH